MKNIKDVKLGEAFGNASIWILIARKRTLDNEDWYIVLALDPEANTYGIGRMMDADSALFLHYTPDFMKAIQCFLNHFSMSVRRKGKSKVGIATQGKPEDA